LYGAAVNSWSFKSNL